ncbi:MAG TPA: hypothetical protein PKA88_23035, partial [Polyangiaceae bacterium]|nr:hypothetical protein [Polyangiaceae bacterium]HMR79368.1 hypothetical protein [Polyangiaceae bacterium]
MTEGTSKPQAEGVPAWKFWHPLPLWHVFVILFIAQFVVAAPVVFIREVLGIGLPTASIGAGGGVLGYFIVMSRAQKVRDAEQAAKK